MVAIRREAEQTVPLSEYQKLQTSHHDLLEKHLRIIKEKDQKIQQLRRQLRFRDELDSVPSKIMSQNHKAAFNKALMTYEEEEKEPDGKALLRKTEELAKSVGMSTKTFQKALSYCDSIGIIEKETKAVRDEETGGVKYMETRIKPTERASYPRLYEAGNPRNHGGDRLMCKCGSEHIKKKVTYICMDCGEVHSEPPRYYPPDDQFGIQVPEQEYEHEQETEESPHSETAIVEGSLVPDNQFGIQIPQDDQIGTQERPNDQFGIQVFSPDQKANLTLLSNTKNLLDQVGIQVEGDSNSAPPLVPTPADSMSILKEWLEKRRGTPRVIQATGQSDVARKYVSKPETYEPNIEAFIAGKIVYGSRLNNPETGLTQVICFECDTPEHSEIAMNSMSALARASIGAIYHERQRERAHFEVYFDQPVDPQIAYQMLLEIDPDLEEISEVFPCKATENRTNHPLSWPMWQRIDNEVYPCKALAILPAPHDGAMREVDPTNLEALVQLVTDAVTPVSLVEEFAIVLEARMEEERLNEQTREQEIEGMGGGAIGFNPSVTSHVQGDDLVPQVLADFDANHSWQDIALSCGGLTDGRFCATWRGSVGRSVVIDPRDNKYAHDYGQVGSYRSHFDKHQAWCYIHGKDRTADLAERCTELRRQQRIITAKEAN